MNRSDRESIIDVFEVRGIRVEIIQPKPRKIFENTSTSKQRNVYIIIAEQSESTILFYIFSFYVTSVRTMAASNVKTYFFYRFFLPAVHEGINIYTWVNR